jgi:hypothetical protein
MNWIPDLLTIVEHALQNPQDKAAVQIAIDGIAWWRRVAGLPETLKLEVDVGIYVALLPPSAKPPAINTPVDPPVQDGVRGGPRGGLMAPGT